MGEQANCNDGTEAVKSSPLIHCHKNITIPTGVLNDPKTLRYRQWDPTGLLDDPIMLHYRQGGPTGILNDPKTLRYREGYPTDLSDV